VIAKSSMHIFHSAITLAPKTSIVRELYGRYSHPFVSVVQGIPNSWDSSIASTKRLASIESITWSSCGRFIGVAWADSTIEILDPVTLDRLYTMSSPLGTKVLTFSPDGRLLLCRGLSTDSLSNFVTGWDVQTGGVVGVRESEAQVKGFPSVVTSSADGDMIAVVYTDPSTPDKFIIRVYESDSGRYVYSHPFNEWFIEIWTHDQSFRFATAEPGTITVWEVELASNSHSKLVETLDTPVTFDPSRPFSFFPPLYLLAYVWEDVVLIVNARSGECFLEAEGANFQGHAMAFSSDGHIFACGTTGPDIYLWKETPSGYAFHQRLISSSQSPVPLFSPDGTSIITWDSSSIQLWSLEGPPAPASMDPPQTTGHPEHFILRFSPGEGSAVVAREKSSTVAVLNLRHGTQQQTIDAGMEVCGLRVLDDTIVVEGPDKFVTWALRVGGDVPGVTMNIDDSITTTMFGSLRPMQPQSASISPDLLRMAVRGRDYGAPDTGSLRIYDISSRRLLAMTPAVGEMLWFAQDGHQVWCDGEVGKEQGWGIAMDDGLTQAHLDPLPIGSPPEGYPWRSSHGYIVTGDGWILNLRGKRLLWLPPHWRSYERKAQVWSGEFLALLHGTLLEPVILRLKAYIEPQLLSCFSRSQLFKRK
jgi:WD40 repeat protein